MFKFSKSSGQVSRLLLVLAVVVLVAVIITYLILKMAEKPSAPPQPTPTPAIPLPVYEQTIGDIRFIFESAIDRGNVLKASQSTNKSARKDFTTGEKFIQVTIGAQNMGKEQIGQGAWDMQNIVDSDGRNFVPLAGYTVNAWLPNPNPCSTLLKPAFDPTPCTKIYEVSKESTGFKVRIVGGKGKSSSFLLDLIVK